MTGQTQKFSEDPGRDTSAPGFRTREPARLLTVPAHSERIRIQELSDCELDINSLQNLLDVAHPEFS
jgi:hypothetical protein